MSKIYIISSIEDRVMARDLAETLIEHGHEITFPWFDKKYWKNGTLEKDNASGRREMASQEVLGLKSSEFVIFIPPGGVGSHFELGISYTLNKKIIIYDPMDIFDNHKTIFYELPDLYHEACIKDKKELMALISLLK